MNFDSDLDAWARSGPEVTKRKNGQEIGPNQLLWDLGVDAEKMYDHNVVENKIKEMEDHFHLVMILEHFDESLILMKDILCWDTQDITNLKLNARKVDEVLNDKRKCRQKPIINLSSQCTYFRKIVLVKKQEIYCQR